MSPLIKTALKYAVICGGMLIAAHIALDLTGAKPLINFSAMFVDLVLVFGFVFFAAKEFKDYLNGGILHFWQGISIGAIIIFTGVVIFTMYMATYYAINETAFQEYITDSIALFDKQRANWEMYLSEEEIASQRALYRKTTVFQLTLGKFVTKLVVGFLIVPLVAVILRKQN